MKLITSVYWTYSNPGYTLQFVNYLTGAKEIRHYKTFSAAKAAETKFNNRVNRIYNNKGIH